MMPFSFRPNFNRPLHSQFYNRPHYNSPPVYNSFHQPPIANPKTYEKHNFDNFNKNENFKEKITNNSSHLENDSQKIFSVFGIDLYLDDLIILSILYFLYNENVNDSYLYIVLLMLLFS